MTPSARSSAVCGIAHVRLALRRDGATKVESSLEVRMVPETDAEARCSLYERLEASWDAGGLIVAELTRHSITITSTDLEAG